MTTLLQNVNEEVFRTYVFWTAVLVVKMLAMSVLTGRQRFRKKVRDYNHERDTHTHTFQKIRQKAALRNGERLFFWCGCMRQHSVFFADY